MSRNVDHSEAEAAEEADTVEATEDAEVTVAAADTAVETEVTTGIVAVAAVTDRDTKLFNVRKQI
jgi:uncharacterized Rossmann fold enzyme